MGNHSVTMPSSSRVLWTTAQLAGLAITVALIAGLSLGSQTALTVLWNLLIPLVPASLLISPAIWRNVCPLATLNMLTNREAGQRELTPKLARYSGIVGIFLLAILVPARRFLFNTDGLALAIVIVLVAVAALALGALFQMKAGFCNAICPVLPVERLYGQRPLLKIGNPRCPSCTLCTKTACIDLVPQKSIAQTLGGARDTHAWTFQPFGIFAAAFPGFVFAYYTTADVSLGGAGAVYLHVLIWAAVSYVLVTAAVRVFNLGAGPTLTVLAAAAAGLYYWYASPIVAETLGAAVVGTAALRVAALALVAVWLWHGFFRWTVGGMTVGR